MHETFAHYMPHGMCLLWKPWLLALHAGSDFLIFAAYFAIPAGIFLFLRRRPDIPLRPVAWLFIAFICLCGVTHLFAIVTLWNPIYESFGLMKLATALVSVATAFMVFRLIPTAVAIPSAADLERLNARLGDEVAAHVATMTQLQEAKAALEMQVASQEVELGKALAILKVVNEATPSNIYAKDTEGKLTYANPALQKLLGKSEDELLGTDEFDFLGDDEEALRIKEIDREVMASGEVRTLEESATARSGARHYFVSSKAPLYDRQGVLQGIVGISTDITERKKIEERMALMMSELKHRGANQLAIISHIARRSLTGDRSLDDAREAFLDRIAAIAKSLEMISTMAREKMDILVLARDRLGRLAAVDFEGPSVMLSPKASQTMSLVFHELFTNAVKYGALSSPGGRVVVRWSIEARDGTETLNFSWRESGGPQVAPPKRAGFGRNVIEALVRHDFEADVVLTFDVSGLAYSFAAPLARLSGEFAEG